MTVMGFIIVQHGDHIKFLLLVTNIIDTEQLTNSKLKRQSML